jgi:hypothetical protein
MSIAWIIAAYILVDAISGFYHLATDKGFNFADQIEMFQNHHHTNTMQGFDWQTFAAGMPVAVVGAWFHSPFFVALGIFGALTQVSHYYAHVRSRNRLIDVVVRFAQRARLIVRPAAHARHHKPPFARDFCLLSGWNNLWLNGVIWLFERRAVA